MTDKFLRLIKAHDIIIDRSIIASLFTQLLYIIWIWKKSDIKTRSTSIGTPCLKPKDTREIEKTGLLLSELLHQHTFSRADPSWSCRCEGPHVIQRVEHITFHLDSLLQRIRLGKHHHRVMASCEFIAQQQLFIGCVQKKPRVHLHLYSQNTAGTSDNRSQSLPERYCCSADPAWR